MFKNLISLFAIVGWPIVVLAVLALRASGSAGLTGIEYAAWLLVAFAPAAAWWIIKRNRPTPSIAEILYDTEHRDKSVEAPAKVTRG